MKASQTALKLLLLTALVVLPMQLAARSKNQQATARVDAPESAALGQVVDRIVEREQHTMQEVRKYSPRAETYLQEFKMDPELGPVVAGDQYYLGRLTFGKTLQQATFHPDEQFLKRVLGGIHKQVLPLYGVRFNLSSPGIFIDERLDRAHYSFTFVHREFLGDVRCLVFNVAPKSHAGSGLFKGRIWVEDQGYNIVRFNGAHVSGASFATPVNGFLGQLPLGRFACTSAASAATG